MAQEPTPKLPLARREVWAWAMYDWANSAYSTLSITVLVSYLKAVLPGDAGDLAWGWGIGLTGLCAAVLSPVLGAVADARASKRSWLAMTTFVGAVACAAMFFATPDRPWLLVALFILAQLGYELAQGFYNAFLPELADERTMGRVSALGYSFGYVGGGLALALFLVFFMAREALGIPKGDPAQLGARLGLLLMGLWWGVFTLPAIIWLRDRSPPRAREQSAMSLARVALKEVGQTLRNIRTYRTLSIFLIAFLLFNDGVQTVITQAPVFAKNELKMRPDQLALLVLMIQFLALPGAWAMGHIGDRFGQKLALSICLGIWIGLLGYGMIVRTETQFWIMGGVLALVLGGVQSVSRAIMGLLTPASRTGEFFGFFNLSGKAFSVFGPILFSSISAATNARWALASLIVFFVPGWLLAARVNIAQGRREAAAAE